MGSEMCIRDRLWWYIAGVPDGRDGIRVKRVETDASIRGTNERRAADAAVNQSGT